MRELILIHGRAQENKDAGALKAEWVAAFTEGLNRTGLTIPIPENAIHLAYYGNTLDDLVHGKSSADAAEVVVRGDAEEQAFVYDVLAEMAEQCGLADQLAQQRDESDAATNDELRRRGVLNWPWVQSILRVIDRHVPFGSSRSIALFTHDAYKYLYDKKVSEVLDRGVMKVFSPDNPSVVVAHSLGSVVAYELLRREGKNNNWQVPLFVTVGSPLGVRAIRKRLEPQRPPRCVGSWYNALAMW